jgi:hypothetical protein
LSSCASATESKDQAETAEEARCALWRHSLSGERVVCLPKKIDGFAPAIFTNSGFSSLGLLGDFPQGVARVASPPWKARLPHPAIFI